MPNAWKGRLIQKYCKGHRHCGSMISSWDESVKLSKLTHRLGVGYSSEIQYLPSTLKALGLIHNNAKEKKKKKKIQTQNVEISDQQLSSLSHTHTHQIQNVFQPFFLFMLTYFFIYQALNADCKV